MICIQYLAVICLFLVTLKCSISTNTTSINAITRIFLPLKSSAKTADSLLLTEAISYAIKMDNKDLKKWKSETNNTNLPLKYSYVLHDISNGTYESISRQFLSSLINIDNAAINTETSQCLCKTKDITLGYVGNFTLDTDLLGMQLLLPYKHPLVSLAYDSPKRDTLLYRQYIQVINSNGDIFKFMENLIKHFDWNFIGLITSEGAYGAGAKSKIIQKLESLDVCIGFDLVFGTNQENDEFLFNAVKSMNELEIIILWMTANKFVDFFKAADRYKIYNKTWIAGPILYTLHSSFFDTLHPLIIHGTIMLADGRFGGSLGNHFPYRNFSNFFWNLSFNDSFERPLLKRFLSEHNITSYNKNITLKNFKTDFSIELINMATDLQRTIKTYNKFIQVARHIKANSSINDIRNYLDKHPRGAGRGATFFWPYILHATYNTALMYNTLTGKYIRIAYILKFWGVYEEFMVEKNVGNVWASFQETAPLGKCLAQCGVGYYHVYVGSKACCWKCINCDEGYIKNETGNFLCRKCPMFTESNRNRTTCLNYTVAYITYDSNVAIKLYVLMAVGLIIAITFMMIFLINFNTPVVKSSNNVLSLIQLMAHTLLYVSIVLSIGPLSDMKCAITYNGVGSLLVVIIGITYSKSDYLICIFKCKVKVSRKKMTITKSRQYIIVVLLFLMHICIVLGLHNEEKQHVLDNRIKETLRNERYCKNELNLISQTIFIALILLGCDFQAFKARNLPANFNESKFILYATFTASITLAAAPVVYTSQEDIADKTLTFNIFTFVINTLLLVIMYGNKCWIIVFRADRNQAHIFREQAFEAMKRKVNSKMSKNSSCRSRGDSTTTLSSLSSTSNR